MKIDKLTYLVIENAVDVCVGIERRMNPFANWKSLGYCTGVKEAIEKVKNTHPDFIYLDWGLNGGSAFEVLQQIQNIPSYNPYILFNTGFQKDNPAIPFAMRSSAKVISQSIASSNICTTMSCICSLNNVGSSLRIV